MILECMPLGAYTKRVWYRGFLNESTYPPPETVTPLFVQMGDTGEVTTSGNRTDMSVDNETFALTIGRLQIHDDGYFTCATEIGNKTLFNGSYTQVYSKLTDFTYSYKKASSRFLHSKSVVNMIFVLIIVIKPQLPCMKIRGYCGVFLEHNDKKKDQLL